jgi:hypothetical protein
VDRTAFFKGQDMLDEKIVLDRIRSIKVLALALFERQIIETSIVMVRAEDRAV